MSLLYGGEGNVHTERPSQHYSHLGIEYLVPPWCHKVEEQRIQESHSKHRQTSCNISKEEHNPCYESARQDGPHHQLQRPVVPGDIFVHQIAPAAWRGWQGTLLHLFWVVGINLSVISRETFLHCTCFIVKHLQVDRRKAVVLLSEATAVRPGGAVIRPKRWPEPFGSRS